VFDIGGVLISHARSWGDAQRRTSLPWDDYLDSPEFHLATRESVYDHMSGRITSDEWYARTAALSGGRLTEEGARLVLEAWLFDEYPGVHDVIEAIHRAGRTTATLSNTNPVHWAQMLDQFPILSRIQHPHASHLLGASKPDRAIFEAFEASTGFSREGILFFDDLQENVDTALAYGWRAELIDHTGDPAGQLRQHLARHGVLG
jgi:putative hydrolase of the HAD superfamily